VFEVLTLPPRLAAQAVEDLHTLATMLRRLTDPDGDLKRLTEAARTLPKVEDELTMGVRSLQVDVARVPDVVRPLNETVAALALTLAGVDEDMKTLTVNMGHLDTDIDGLRAQVGTLTEEVQGFRQDLAELRDKIPGL